MEDNNNNHMEEVFKSLDILAPLLTLSDCLGAAKKLSEAMCVNKPEYCTKLQAETVASAALQVASGNRRPLDEHVKCSRMKAYNYKLVVQRLEEVSKSYIEAETPSPSSSNPTTVTREGSRRKRIKKSIGEEFVTDYLANTRSTDSLQSDLAIARRASRLTARQERKKYEQELRNKTVEAEALFREEEKQVCKECGTDVGTSSLDKAGDKRFIHCTELGCLYVAHAGCTGISASGEPENQFKCLGCKQCAVCQSGKIRKNNRLIQCSACFRIFHVKCHNPPIDASIGSTELVGGTMCYIPGWRCSTCTATNKPCVPKQKGLPGIVESERPKISTRTVKIGEFDLKDDSSSNASVQSSSDAAKQIRNVESEQLSRASSVASSRPSVLDVVPLPRKPNVMNGNMPKITPKKIIQDPVSQEDRELRQDLCTWGVEQCAAYFMDSQPALSQLITEHELFGSSLMLMSRAQFLSMFGMSVGKGVKLYAALCKWRKITF